ncbi:MAG: ATP synthase F1 subunit epsilon [Magnetovibrio sp.]|nr:ATP synthase F1 subunit epsilon [Magnetovibrio sp.]|tara:strand:+ start:1217 stop:1600 length:384 start_codon:yes stop_codon:yes gene_type:complete
MTNTVEFELVSPEQLVTSQPVKMVVVPGTEGDLGILPGHAPLIAELRPGVIDIRDGEKITEKIFVSGGFCEILPERCTVLADEAIPFSEINKEVAEQRLHSAKETENENELRIAEVMLAAATTQSIS